MAIRTRTSDGYQQVELTSELLHSQSGATQQVISTVPCSKHLPFFFAILLADVLLFGAVILFALYATHFADGFSYVQQPEAPLRQFNLHALIMITALVYLNGQAITVYKSNYLVKHKSLNMLYHFVLHLLTVAGVAAGLYMSFSAQEATQARAGKPSASHFYSLHSWAGLATVLLFAAQFLFGFFSFFVTLCCRKLTARWRARALPAHRVLAMFVLCGSLIAVVSGLTQLARFQLDGREGRANYGDLSAGGLLVNLSGASALLAAALIFLITFVFKRRQAHDLPVLFKMVLLVSQFVELVLILVVAEFIFQLVTPHVNRAINEHFATSNATLTHIFNNATRSISTFIASASQHFSSSGGQQAPAVGGDTPTELLNRSSTILLGSNATSS